MECVDCERPVVAAEVATPPDTVTAEPNGVVPSLNCTVPAADDGVTDAVNVTDVPAVVGLGGVAVTVVTVAVGLGPPPAELTT